MTEAEWLASKDPLSLLPFLRTPWADWESKGSNRRGLQLFACATCRRFWPLLTELGLQAALEVTERDADGGSDFDETQAVVRAAWAIVHQLPKSAPGYSVSSATAWATCGRPNRYFAEYVVRVLLSQNGRWAPIKSLLGRLGFGTRRAEQRDHVRILHDIFGNPFRPVTVDPCWLTSTVVALARDMYDSRDFSAMPILADALQDAGCEDEQVLNHCRGPNVHVRGCFVVDLLLEKA